MGIFPRIQCRLHSYTSRWRQGFFILCVSQSVADSLKGSYDTKTIKPIINEAFVASSGDIITDYNDSYGLSITMSAFVIRETTNTTLHSSKLAFESPVANSLNMNNILTCCESEVPDYPCKVAIANRLVVHAHTSKQVIKE